MQNTKNIFDEPAEEVIPDTNKAWEQVLARTRLLKQDRNEWAEIIQLPMDATTVPLYYDEGNKRAFDWVAVVNEKGEWIGPASYRYKVINHKAVLTDLAKHLTKLGMAVNMEDTTMWLSENHAKMRARIWFNGHDYRQEYAKNDIIRMGIEVYNTYDCSGAARVSLIAERLVCTNGMKCVGHEAMFSQRHTSEWDSNNIQNWLSTTTPVFAQYINSLKGLGNVEVGPDYFKAILFENKEIENDVNFLNEFGLDSKIVNSLRALPKTNRIKVLNQFELNEQKNAWGAYNAFTWVATHNVKNVIQSEKLEDAANNWSELILP